MKQLFNLNKLAPRLTISAKLAIAFAFLTTVPVLVIALVGAPMAVRQLREQATATLQADLELVALRASGAIREADQHLSFLLDAFMEEAIRQGPSSTSDAAQRTAETFLRSDSSAVLRVKGIDPGGRLVFVASHAPEVAPSRGQANEEEYYRWRAENLAPEHRAYVPVELLGEGADPMAFTVVPAIAIIQPIFDPPGTFLGAAVVEASAAALFAGLDRASPGFAGVTGLVDAEGRLLYHSERKRDWSSLLSAGADGAGSVDFGPAIWEQIVGGRVGTIADDVTGILSFRPVRFNPAERPSLFLYRIVPPEAFARPVSNFLLVMGMVGTGVLMVGLMLSIVAARQFTKPIYELQRAARALAAHDDVPTLHIDTNDELEDLARDFSGMAAALVARRRNLEDKVEARTRALKMTQVELSQVVTHAADAIVGLDAQDRVRLWNDGARDLFGFDVEEAIGRNIDDLIGSPDESSQYEAAYIRQSVEASGAVVNLATTRIHKNGTPIEVSLTETQIRDHDGKVQGMSVIIRDNRVQRRLEKHMLRSERLAAASIMAAGLAHELNNPLAILGNRIELMQREADRTGADERFRKDLAVLLQHVERIRRVTTDLLVFARDEHDEPKIIDISTVARRVARLLERTFATNGIEFLQHIEDDTPPIVGNEQAVETVVANLLMNAVQATPPRGRVTIDVGRVRDGGGTRLQVSDLGPGIPKEARERIFEPFFTTKGGSGGTGLGLTVCRSIVERHHGEIRVEEGPEGGSRFVVVFPTQEGQPT